MGDRMSSEQRARLLHAKAGELENRMLMRAPLSNEDLTADLALLFGMMAQHVEEEIQEP